MGRVEDKWCSTDTRFDQIPPILQKSVAKPSSISLAWVEPLLLTGESTLAPRSEADGSPKIVCAPRCRVLGAMDCVVLFI